MGINNKHIMSNEKVPLVGPPLTGTTVAGGAQEEEHQKKKKKKAGKGHWAYGGVVATTMCLGLVASNKNGLFPSSSLSSPLEAAHANLLRSSTTTIGALLLPDDALLLQDTLLSSDASSCTHENKDPYNASGDFVRCCHGLDKVFLGQPKYSYLCVSGGCRTTGSYVPYTGSQAFGEPLLDLDFTAQSYSKKSYQDKYDFDDVDEAWQGCAKQCNWDKTCHTYTVKISTRAGPGAKHRLYITCYLHDSYKSSYMINTGHCDGGDPFKSVSHVSGVCRTNQ